MATLTQQSGQVHSACVGSSCKAKRMRGTVSHRRLDWFSARGVTMSASFALRSNLGRYLGGLGIISHGFCWVSTFSE